MRISSILISGAVAAVAVAGSASASVVTVNFDGLVIPASPGYIGMTSYTNSPNPPYEGFRWSSAGAMNQAYWQATYGGNTSGFSGNIVFGSATTTITWAGVGAIDLVSLNMGKAWPNLGSGNVQATSVTINGFNGATLVDTATINLTSSVQNFTFGSGFDSITSFTISGNGGNSWFYYGGFSYIPAPGAVALLGTAGLVGSRRRRN